MMIASLELGALGLAPPEFVPRVLAPRELVPPGLENRFNGEVDDDVEEEKSSAPRI